MHIWFLDSNPVLCARAYQDNHILGGVRDAAHCLSQAHIALDGPTRCRARGVPMLGNSTVDAHNGNATWTRQCSANYEWMYQFMAALCIEHHYRFGGFRPPYEIAGVTAKLIALPVNITFRPVVTQFRQTVPIIYTRRDPIEGNRAYYVAEKQKLAKWTKRGAPIWWKQGEVA